MRIAAAAAVDADDGRCRPTRRSRSAAAFPRAAATRASRAHSRGPTTPAHDAIDLVDAARTDARASSKATRDGVTVRLQDGRTRNGGHVARAHRACVRRHDSRRRTVRVGSRRAARAAPFTIERDARGRVALLRQDGWEVVYAYADDAAAAAVSREPELPGRRHGRSARRRRSLAVSARRERRRLPIDTFGAVGENRRLFRRLRTQPPAGSATAIASAGTRSRDPRAGPWRARNGLTRKFPLGSRQVG